MVQRNGRCRKHNDLILQSPDRALRQEALPAPTSMSNAAQEIDEQAMEDRFKKYASDIVEEANRKINEAEQKALQASTDASTALEMAKQAQARADALENSQRASAHFEDGLKAELEAKYKAEMEQKYRIEMEAKYKIEAEAKQKAEAEAFAKLQAEAREAAERERQNQSFNTRLNDVATKAKANVAEQVATVEDKLRDSAGRATSTPTKAPRLVAAAAR